MAFKLCTIDDLKLYAEIEGTGKYDMLLNTIIESMTKRFEQQCNRVFEHSGANDITEYFSGFKGQTIVIVKRPPITAFTSLADDTSRVYATILVDGTDFVRTDAEGKLELDGFTFSAGLNNIRVVYRGGYTEDSIPADLAMACLLQSTALFKWRTNEGVASISNQGGNVSLFEPIKLLPEVKSTLAKYTIHRSY